MFDLICYTYTTFHLFDITRHLLRLIVILILSFLFDTLLFAEQTKLEKVTLQLQWRYQFQFAGFIVAKERGYYKDVGLDVDILEYQNRDSVQDLLDKKIDFAINNSIISYRDKRLQDVTLLATYFQRSPLVMVTQPEIKTPLDLLGKRIMMSENNRLNSSLSILLEYFDITDDKASFIDPTFDLQDFITKKVDAVTAFRSNELFELDQKKIAYNLIDPIEFGFSTNAINLFATYEKTQKEPQQIRRFLSATKKGWAYALEHVDEVAHLIHEHYQPAKSLENLIYEGETTKALMLPDLYEIGEINKDFVLKTFHQLVKGGKLDPAQAPDRLIFDCGDDETLVPLTVQERAWIRSHPVVTYSEVDWRPLSIIEDDQMKGIMGDYLDIVSKRTGLTFRYLPSDTWSDVLDAFKEKEIDLVPGIGSSMKEKSLGLVSEEYAEYPMVIITGDDLDYLNGLDDLKGKTIAVPRHYTSHNFIKENYPYLKVLQTSSIPEALLLVETGKADAFVGHIATSLYYISRLGLQGLKIAGEADLQFHHHYLIQKEDPELLRIVDKVFGSLTAEDRAAIYARWVKVQVDERIDEVLIWKIVGVLSLVIFFLIYRQRTLQAHQKEVETLKRRMELALWGSDAGLWDHDISKESIYFSRRWKEMLGYKDEEVPNLFSSWKERIHPDDLPGVMKAIDANLHAETEFFENTHRLRHKDGYWKWVLTRAKTLYDRHGNAMRMIGTHTDVTIEKETQIRLALLLDSINAISWEFDLIDDRFTYVSPNAQRILGHPLEAWKDFRSWSMMIHEEDRDYATKYCKLETERGNDHVIEYRMLKSDGSILWMLDVIALGKDHEGRPNRLFGFLIDITQRKHAEIESHKQSQYLQSVIDAVHDPIMVIDEDYSIDLMNSTLRKQMETSFIADPENPKCYEVAHHRSTPCDKDGHPCPLEQVMHSHQNTTVVHKHKTPKGSNRYLELAASPLFDKEHNCVGIIESTRDITTHLRVQDELREQKDLMSHQAHHDHLTDLPNRLLFNDRLLRSIEKAKRNEEEFALLFIDLDRFKQINDSLGHEVGDKVLRIISNRLSSLIRQADTLARLGGDEFTIIMEGLSKSQDASLLAQKIIEDLARPMEVEGHMLYVSSSIGISLYPQDHTDAQDLLKFADAAMYRAKDEGRNNFQFYKKEMTALAFEHVVMEANLRDALRNEEFIVYYQPQVDAVSDTLIGMEALVRWAHPTMGIIPPSKFLPLAKETGLIVALDQWVMVTAMKQTVQWYKDGHNPGRLALNLAMGQLQQRRFVSMLRSISHELGFDPRWLEMEVTEGEIMRDPEATISHLKEISELGIELAVDDFGTGYSSLAYLKRLPIDRLKIDQSFIRDLPDDEEDAAITKAVIALGNNLSLHVLAEGVETEQQKAFLIENGCQAVQGHLIGRPMPAEEFEQEFLQPKKR